MAISKALALFVSCSMVNVGRARRVQDWSTAALSLDAEPVRCPMNSGSQATKNYFFDLPGDNITLSTAVHLIRDPRNPRLVIYKGSVWHIWQKVNSGRNLVGNVHFEAHTPEETGYSGAVKAEFDLLKDSISIKRTVEGGVATFEYEHNKCSGPIRPARFGLLDETEYNTSFAELEDETADEAEEEMVDEEEEEEEEEGEELADDSQEADESQEVEEGDAAVGGFSKGKGKGKRKGSSRRGSGRAKGKGKGKGKKGKGKMGAGPIRAGRGPTRPSRGAYDCPMKFAGGTFYPAERVKRAMRKALARASGEKVTIVAQTETDSVGITPALQKAGSGTIAAGGLGFLTIIPAVWLSAEKGVVFGPIGFVAGVAVSGLIAMAQIRAAAHESRMTAAEKMFEKLWCMSFSKSCNGRPCFARCTDAKGNLALVPFDKAGTSKLMCKTS